MLIGTAIADLARPLLHDYPMTDAPDRPAADAAPETPAPAPTPKPPPPAARRPRPVAITAVEIENFKAIGRPVRIDLRPITLLFGRNSAGKSTILHALCYAHEILSHRSVDVSQTEIGGEQTDLGGFRNFVHRHETGRAIRLRFELNLEDWWVPEHLLKQAEELVSNRHDPDWRDWVRERGKDISNQITSGWVELVVEQSGGQPLGPAIASYAVGVNDAAVGCIRPRPRPGVRNDIEFNAEHPLLALGTADFELEPQPAPAPAGRVRETAGPEGDHWTRRHASAPSPSLSPMLPDWNELLDPEGADLNDLASEDTVAHLEDAGLKFDTDDDDEYRERFEEAFNAIRPYRARFQTAISAILVGIGHALKEELSGLRYIGPVRNRQPELRIEPGAPKRTWSDGSAAWELLLSPGYTPHLTLDAVNDWLAGKDRLDTGYKLRRQSHVILSEDAPLVAAIRSCKAFDFDLKRWARQLAVSWANIILGDDPSDETKIADIEALIRSGQPRSGQPADDIIVKTSHGSYQAVSRNLATVEAARKGENLSLIRKLIDAIAEAEHRERLELVTADDAKLPVRTSDVGVGISQVVPIVVAALDPERPGITAIEQPELHLHPKLAVELGDLFAHPIDRGGVFLIENHSEHLMLRLLRRIEETHGGDLPEGKPPLQPDQVSVVYLSQTGGEVQAKRLRIDETGEFIDRWPQGFFDERDDELF